MDKTDKIGRMTELVKLLDTAAKAYYQGDKEIMSNASYDSLYDELLSLEKETGEILENSPTKSVGYAVLSNLEKISHESRMLSLDKTKEIDKLVSFVGEEKGLLSWKLDGLTIVLKYENGSLVRAVTRGNGEIGEDVTHNALHFKGVPKKVKYEGAFTLRGEAVISYANFDKLNESLEDGEKFKNPRNLCSGAVRQLDSKVSAGRHVEFYVFSVICDEDFADLKSNSLKWAESLGFQTVEYHIAHKNNMEELVEGFREKVKDFGLPTDGLVLSFDSVSYSRSLGETSKFPKDSLAFKWADEIKQTTLIEIIWNTSRTGLINPIAVFESVELEGTSVNRASLHNLSIVEGLEIGVGDTIEVYKANMIIPQVAENITRSGNIEIPSECSVCGAKTQIKEQNGIKTLNCPNPNCAAQQVKSLTHFCARDAMNIEGLSEATIEKFVEAEILKNYTDIFRLDKHSEKIREMKGFGEKSYVKLINSVDKSKNCNLFSFIYALGINQIGLESAKLLCANFDDDIKSIKLSLEKGELLEEIQGIDGFGEIMAKSVLEYFSNEKNMALMEDALSFLNIQKREKAAEDLKGLTFVITGDVQIFESRRKLQEYIEKKGGKTASAVSAKTSYLINNDTQSQSAKNKKARELGIPIISEAQFAEDF